LRVISRGHLYLAAVELMTGPGGECCDGCCFCPQR
jgi:hypothetical protein